MLNGQVPFFAIGRKVTLPPTEILLLEIDLDDLAVLFGESFGRVLENVCQRVPPFS